MPTTAIALSVMSSRTWPRVLYTFTSARRAQTLNVLGVVVNGEARAYPQQILNVHEVINDTLGGVPIAVTYSPWCASAKVFDRRLEGHEKPVTIHDVSARLAIEHRFRDQVACPSVGEPVDRARRAGAGGWGADEGGHDRGGPAAAG